MTPRLRMIQVAATFDLSPHMRRIVLTGAELNDFPANKESAHVKVIVPDSNERPSLRLFSKHKRDMRSYTIRKFDDVNKALTIDFAVNDHQGRISEWASNAKMGDYLGIAGPGSVKHTNFEAPWHLFIGDLTALPAIAATLEKLPDDAKGKAFIQVPLQQDMQVFKAPKGIDIEWLVSPYTQQNLLLDSLKKMQWPELTPAIFLAAEATHVKEIKRYIGNFDNVDKNQLYSSAYWNAKKSASLRNNHETQCIGST